MSPRLAAQEDLSCRLLRLDDREQGLRSKVEKTTTVVVEKTNPITDSSSPGGPTYADELALNSGDKQRSSSIAHKSHWYDWYGVVVQLAVSAVSGISEDARMLVGFPHLHLLFAPPKIY